MIARKVEDNQIIKIDQTFLDRKSIYYAPELIKTGALNKAADIYSAGHVIKALKL